MSQASSSEFLLIETDRPALLAEPDVVVPFVPSVTEESQMGPALRHFVKDAPTPQPVPQPLPPPLYAEPAGPENRPPREAVELMTTLLRGSLEAEIRKEVRKLEADQLIWRRKTSCMISSLAATSKNRERQLLGKVEKLETELRRKDQHYQVEIVQLKGEISALKQHYQNELAALRAELEEAVQERERVAGDPSVAPAAPTPAFLPSPNGLDFIVPTAYEHLEPETGHPPNFPFGCAGTQNPAQKNYDQLEGLQVEIDEELQPLLGHGTPNDHGAYTCKICHTTIAYEEDVLARDFQVGPGEFEEKKRGYFFERTYNLNNSMPTEETFQSGTYMVSWQSCRNCDLRIGWKYLGLITAPEENANKIGGFVIKRNCLQSFLERNQKKNQ